MFGLFRRKPVPKASSTLRPDEATASELIGRIAKMLSIQIAFLPAPAIEDTQHNINRKAIGYIYGFVDSFITARGYDMSDSQVGPPITFHVLRNLFPGLGAYHAQLYIEFLMNHMADEVVGLGMMVGGQQFLDYYTPKKKIEGAPMGLARFILEGGTYGRDEGAGDA